MTTAIRSGTSDSGILVNGVEQVTIDSTGITKGAGKRLAQMVTFQTGAVATGTTLIPEDNTVPQNTEGDQYMSLAITPTNVNSTLEIDISLNVSANSAASFVISALFQDAIANALSAVKMVTTGTTGEQQVTFKHIMTAGTTSATTFKVRAGQTLAGTLTFNGQGGTQFLGGVMASRITIKEYLP